jgi:hypothetical protein
MHHPAEGDSCGDDKRADEGGCAANVHAVFHHFSSVIAEGNSQTQSGRLEN